MSEAPEGRDKWRRERDSNPRCPCGAYSISSRAPSTTRPSLQAPTYCTDLFEKAKPVNRSNRAPFVADPGEWGDNLSVTKADSLKELRQIPGIGKSIAEDLWNIGIRSIADVKRSNPEELYRRSCEHQGCTIDRCLLYTYRCAVYYASHTKHDPELLKWWKWKDKK